MDRLSADVVIVFRIPSQVGRRGRENDELRERLIAAEEQLQQHATTASSSNAVSPRALAEVGREEGPVVGGVKAVALLRAVVVEREKHSHVVLVFRIWGDS